MSDDDRLLEERYRLVRRIATNFASTTAVRLDDESERARPYDMWIWFTASEDGPPMARMYTAHHYRGRVTLGEVTYTATVFEQGGHNALYRDAGVCIDLSRDGACDESEELFHDGDVMLTPVGNVRVRLAYP